MWNKMYINDNQIEREFENSLLIKMPASSRYSGWMFFHPYKLVREGTHSANFSISFTDEWDFRLVKGKDQEMYIDNYAMLEAFGNLKENKEMPDNDNESFLKITEPSPIEGVEVEVKEELRNNE